MASLSRSTVLIAVFLATVAAAAAPVAAGEFLVAPTEIPEMKAVFAEVKSRTVVPARARIGGTIREIRVSEGSEVKEGEVVAVVVDDKLAFEANAAEARIAALRSQYANAETELDRAQQLLSRGIATQSRLDQAKMQFDVVANQVAAAEADKAVVEQKSHEGEILAPASGRVLTVPVTPGSVILAGEEIARVATGQYYLRLSLPERHAADIVEGATVRIGERGLSPGKAGGIAAARPGRIAKVYPEIADGRVLADVDVAGLGDYFVNERTLAWVPVGSRTALAVPPQAVATRHGIDYVRVLTVEGPLDVAVILGQPFEADGEPRVEILTGLDAGDRVVLP